MLVDVAVTGSRIEEERVGRSSLSSEASQEFRGLVLEWLYRQDEIEVTMPLQSRRFEELMELCLAWSRAHRTMDALGAHEIGEGQRSEQRQQAYCEIFALFHSEEYERNRLSESLLGVERHSKFLHELKTRHLL